MYSIDSILNEGRPHKHFTDRIPLEDLPTIESQIMWPVAWLVSHLIQISGPAAWKKYRSSNRFD